MKKSRRPSIEKTTETRHKIVLSALHEFKQLGFSKARISEIAAQAGLGKGTIYSYFTTKELLFEAVIDYLIAETYQPLQSKELSSNQSVYDFLREKMLEIMVNFESSGRGDIARLVLKESHYFPQIRKLYVQKIYQQNLQETERLLEIAVERKELLTDQPLHELAALVIAPIWMGMIHNEILMNDKMIEPATMFELNLSNIFKI